VRGAVKVAAVVALAFKPGTYVHVGRPGEPGDEQELEIVESRAHSKFLVVRLGGIDDMDAARQLMGSNVLVRPHDLSKLPPHTFRAADLIGFVLKDRVLGSLGTVRAVRRYPACDMLVVGEAGTLVPMLVAYRMTVHRKKKEILVALPPGFEEL
jgi:16S rRNA processing protein RimM